MYLYFLLDSKHEKIKIGKSNKIEVRVEKLYRDTSIDFINSFYFFIGNERKTYDLESYFHKKFAKYRISLKSKIDGHTEWFKKEILNDNEFKNTIRLFKKIFTANKVEPVNKILKEEKRNYLISEKTLIYPFLATLYLNRRPMSKMEIKKWIENGLILKKEERLNPPDRKTTYFEIRIDNIISHKTIEKKGFVKINKIKQRAMIELTEKGIEEIRKVFSREILFMFYLSQYHAVKNTKLAADGILIEREGKYIYLTKKGKEELNKRIRSL